MRLIDADALWKEVTSKIEYCEEFLEIIENMPTEEIVQCEDAIDRYSALAVLNPCSAEYKEMKTLPSVPVRHGKWKNGTDNTEYKECSLCGWVHDVLSYGNNYCPNCGARMEVEE